MGDDNSPHPQPPPNIQYHYDVAALQADATVIDLGAPFVSLFPEDEHDVNVKDEDRIAPNNNTTARGVKREREEEDLNMGMGADLYMVSVPPGSEGRREHHNKHTRRCRARLKSKFDSLMATLPPPSSLRGEVKHKVQVLDYAMEVFESLDEELRLLEWNLALKSHKHLLRWVISQEDPTQAFVDLFCNKFGFVYAEVWGRKQKSINNDSNVQNNLQIHDGTQTTPNWVVEKFSCHQTSWVDEETLSEIITTGQKLIKHQTIVHNGYTEDIGDNENQNAALPRTSAGQENSTSSDIYHPRQVIPNHLVHSPALRTCLLVPVFVMGDAARIVALFDVRVNRVISARILQLAATIAANIGNITAANAYGTGARKARITSVPTPLPPSPSLKQKQQQQPSSSNTNPKNSSARPKT